MTEQRINISPVAKEYKRKGLARRLPAVKIDGIEPGSTEAVALFEGYKPELYALTAVISDHVVRSAYDRRKPASQEAEKFEGELKFINLGHVIRQRMGDVLRNEYQASFIKGVNPTPVTQAIKRMDIILKNLHPVLPTMIHRDSQSFLSSGLSTANDVMSGILNTIPEVHGSQNPDELIEVAENAYPLILELAADNSEITIPLLTVIRGGIPLGFVPFSSSYFGVKEINKKKYLALSQQGEAVKRFMAKKSETLNPPSTTVGCPAMINFGGGSAVQTLWNWYIEHARVLYPRFAAALS